MHVLAYEFLGNPVHVKVLCKILFGHGKCIVLQVQNVSIIFRNRESKRRVIFQQLFDKNAASAVPVKMCHDDC